MQGPLKNKFKKSFQKKIKRRPCLVYTGGGPAIAGRRPPRAAVAGLPGDR
jgi:hypothetical protein